MPLTRPTFISTSFLVHCLCWLLLGTGLALPASARTHRVHKTHRKHSRRHYVRAPRMLPTIIPSAREGYTTVLRGHASWYGLRFQGRRTSSGERFNCYEYTCAHKTLPFGTRLRVTNVKNGKAVVVRVIDRGPFRDDRIVDLAKIAAGSLNLVKAGSGTVVAEIVSEDTPLGAAETPDNLEELQASDPNPRAPFTAYQLPAASPEEPVVVAAAPVASPATTATDTPATKHFLVQAGSFTDTQTAQAMQARILTIDQALPVEVVTTTVAGRPVSRVVVSQLNSWLAAETVRRNLQLWGIAGLVYQLPADQLAGTGQLVAHPAASAPLASAAPLK